VGEEKKIPDQRKNPEGFGRFEELLEYFEKGKAFTQELMRENERLRMQALKLEKEKLELQTRNDPEQLSRLLEENRDLHGRLEFFEVRFDEIEKENNDFANRYVEIQAQNDNLVNLYVSSYQLHSTLDPEEVVRVIKEIILNLIGAEEFYICMVDPKKNCPFIIAGEGPEGPFAERRVENPDSILEGVLEKGQAYFQDPSEGHSPHLACTPLKVKKDIVGAISIQKLLEQKEGRLTPIDHELLRLLSDHAATALMSSNLYNRTERKLRTIESFIGILKLDGVRMS
jgi:hypothetical protein